MDKVQDYKTTEAQRRASRKYQEKTVCIQIRVEEEKRGEYKKAAAKLGMSLAEYVKYKLDL